MLQKVVREGLTFDDVLSGTVLSQRSAAQEC